MMASALADARAARHAHCQLIRAGNAAVCEHQPLCLQAPTCSELDDAALAAHRAAARPAHASQPAAPGAETASVIFRSGGINHSLVYEKLKRDTDIPGIPRSPPAAGAT